MSTTMQPVAVLCDDARPMLLRIAHGIWVEAGLDYTIDDIEKSIRCAEVALGFLKSLGDNEIEAGAEHIYERASWGLSICASDVVSTVVDAIIAEARS